MLSAVASLMMLIVMVGAAPQRRTDALDVFDYYVGAISPERPEQFPWQSAIQLDWGVGQQALRFVGTWRRENQPSEFVSGLIAWDPVEREITIAAMFYHGAYFRGRVVVLDRDKHIVRREWTGHYPDGRTAEYRETWTPVSGDVFEWKIEVRRDGVWRMDLPPGLDAPPRYRVVRIAKIQAGVGVHDRTTLSRRLIPLEALLTADTTHCRAYPSNLTWAPPHTPARLCEAF